MTTTLQRAEEKVAALIEATNRLYIDHGTSWRYELTTEVDNIGIWVTGSSQTLQVNPHWLRFVVSSGDFQACVADEITAWYLIGEFTGAFSSGVPSGRR
jgi:hypothetical protein